MKSFSWSYKLLHWLMALLILIMFFALLGFYPEMNNQDRTIMLIGHSSIGTIISVLALIRISKRFVLKHERPQHDLPSKQATAAKYTHYGLYLLMVLVPLSGYLTANFHHLPVQLFGSIMINGTANAEAFSTIRLLHSTFVVLLIFMVIVHVFAALMHKFVLKDNVLHSIRPWYAKK